VGFERGCGVLVMTTGGVDGVGAGGVRVIMGVGVRGGGGANSGGWPRRKGSMSSSSSLSSLRWSNG
jgi:hypothetical protein